MKRPAKAENTLERIRAWRAIRPNLTIRSTFIVGFPGETESEFGELLDFLEEAELDRVGCFAYSPVDGAAANALPDAVPDAIKEERRARFMQAQAANSTRRLRAQIGRSIDVLVDAIDGPRAIARGAGDAPEIDGIVSVIDGEALTVGEFARVTVTEADQHDLVARCAA